MSHAIFFVLEVYLFTAVVSLGMVGMIKLMLFVIRRLSVKKPQPATETPIE